MIMFLQALRQRALPGVRQASSMSGAQKAIYHLVDHDGCWGEPFTEPKALPEVHQAMIEHIKEQQAIKGYTHRYAAIGSNRQTLKLDALNALQNENGLAYPAMNVFTHTVDATYDPFLLSDITVGKKAGFNLALLRKHAREANVKLHGPIVDSEFLESLLEKKHPGFLYSQEKVNILYAFGQRAGHFNGPVDLHFYDDLIKLVLEPAALFFKRFPTLLPNNVTLRFHAYASETLGERPLFQNRGNIPSLITEVKGEGVLDPNYYDTTQKMTRIAEEEEGKQSTYHLSEYLTPERLFEASVSLGLTATKALSSIGLFKSDKPDSSKTEEKSTNDTLSAKKK